METLRKKLATEAVRAATADMFAPRTRLRARPSGGSDKSEIAMEVTSNGFTSRHRNGSTVSRNTSTDSPVCVMDPRKERLMLIFDDQNEENDENPNNEIKEDDQDGWEDQEDDEGEEVDELQDDSSLIAESDTEEAKRGGRKRRRRASPPTRISARKRPRRDAEEAAKTNGTKTNGAGPVPEGTKLKSSKGQNTKFWYFEEGSAAPAKRPPEMLDDPDAMLKRRRSTKKDLDISMNSTTIPHVEQTTIPAGVVKSE